MKVRPRVDIFGNRTQQTSLPTTHFNRMPLPNKARNLNMCKSEARLYAMQFSSTLAALQKLLRIYTTIAFRTTSQEFIFAVTCASLPKRKYISSRS